MLLKKDIFPSWRGENSEKCLKPLAIEKVLLQIWQSAGRPAMVFSRETCSQMEGLPALTISFLIFRGESQPPKQWDLWYINTYDHTSSSPTQKKKPCIPHSASSLLQLSLQSITTANSPAPHHHRDKPDSLGTCRAKDHFKPWPLKIFQLHRPGDPQGQGHGEPFPKKMILRVMVWDITLFKIGIDSDLNPPQRWDT